MQFLNITGNTATDTGNPPAPGSGPYGTWLALNLHSAAVSVQESDDDGATDPYTDVSGSEGAGIASNQAASLLVKKRYLKLEGGAGQVVLFRT